MDFSIGVPKLAGVVADDRPSFVARRTLHGCGGSFPFRDLQIVRFATMLVQHGNGMSLQTERAAYVFDWLI
jgi:hypothetical protein